MLKDAYYFSHDANARHDPKIVKMLTKYKYGYQWYFMIVEILREQSNFKYRLDEYSYGAIARELCEEPEQIKNFIQDCVKTFKLFLSDDEYFWSNSLNKRMRMKAKKSKIYAENAKKRVKNLHNISKDLAQPLQSNCSALKESKVKESKVNNISPQAVSKSLHNSIKETFVNFYNHYKKPNEYYWSAADAGQVKNVINRIKAQSTAPLPDDVIVKAFKRILYAIPDKGWLWDNLSMSIIVNKWNEINSLANETDRGKIVKLESEKKTETRGGKPMPIADIVNQVMNKQTP